MPALRVELIKEASLGGMAYRSVDRARRVNELHKAWDKLNRQHPERVTITVLARGDRDPLGSWRD
jgi:hypothetical protein